MSKSKKDPSSRECANCGSADLQLTFCGRCRATPYCGKPCQTQHWKAGHKGQCVALEDRKPSKEAIAETPCAICLDELTDALKLSCGHSYHKGCVDRLRKFGVNQVCPLCRATLPTSPESLFDDATEKYVVIYDKVVAGLTSWNKVGQEMKEIVRMYTEAADQGHVGSQCNLGIIYSEGEGVPKDFAKAMRLFHLAAEKGDSFAQHNLGNMYSETDDIPEAAKWYRKSAEQGHAEAQRILGNIYHNGIPRDDQESTHWWRKAADQGDDKSQYNLGCSYYHGEGVHQDYRVAAQWLRKAADQGNLDAQYNMGRMYLHGEGLPQSDAEAVKWYRRAAIQGNAESQFNLGNLYKIGKGVKQSDQEATKWWRKAAEQGHAFAKSYL
jgi:TPR repeat protein